MCTETRARIDPRAQPFVTFKLHGSMLSSADGAVAFSSTDPPRSSRHVKALRLRSCGHRQRQQSPCGLSSHIPPPCAAEHAFVSTGHGTPPHGNGRKNFTTYLSGSVLMQQPRGHRSLSRYSDVAQARFPWPDKNLPFSAWLRSFTKGKPSE